MTRNRLATCAALGLAWLLPVCAFADTEFHIATGADLGFQNRNEYGASAFTRYDPEFVVHSYFGGFLGDVWLRPSLRLAYLTEQPEMPQNLRVEERDLRFTGELGIVYDWYIVPSLTAGGGLISRKIKMKSRAPVSGETEISHSERLPLLYVQGGVGVPLWNGFVMAEPFYRRSWVKQDYRITFTYGVEVTVQVF